MIHHAQTPFALLGIRLVMDLYPFLMLMTLGLIALYFYLTLKETKEMKKKLQEIHTKKGQL